MTRFLSKLVYWFKYRFHPKHRYHVLKLHEPRYCDPRYQLILAVMGIVDRYVDELRKHKNETNIEVLQREVSEWEKEIEKGDDIWPELLQDHLEYTEDLLEIVEWWERVKDNRYLDFFCEGDPQHVITDLDLEEDVDLLTVEKVNEQLKKVIDLRTGLWT